MIRRSPRNTPTTANSTSSGQNLGNNQSNEENSNTPRNIPTTLSNASVSQKGTPNRSKGEIENSAGSRTTTSNVPSVNNNMGNNRPGEVSDLAVVNNSINMSNQNSTNNQSMRDVVNPPQIPQNSNTPSSRSSRPTLSAQTSSMSTHSEAFPDNLERNQGNLSSSFNFTFTQDQFHQIMSNMNTKPESKTTFVNCSARFNGGRNTTKVEDFIATILVYKEAENVSDTLALTSFPLLLEGYASTWWQGVQYEAKNFEMAIDLLRKAFSPPKPDWRIFAEITQDKQKVYESTDVFICRKRRLFAQLSEKLTENTMLNMIFFQLNLSIREKLSRDNVRNFQDLLQKARDIEMFLDENKMSRPRQETPEKMNMRCSFCRKKNHTIDTSIL